MGWEKGKPRKPKEIAMEEQKETVTVELTPQMALLLQQMQKNSLETTLAAVAEMKKPDAETQAKLDDEKARRKANALHLAEQTREGEVAQKSMQESCAHTKGNGLTAFVAQINSDGCYQAFCPMCHYTSPRIKAEEWQKTEGLNMHKMCGLTIATLEGWAARSGPPDKLRRVPVGMLADLSAA